MTLLFFLCACQTWDKKSCDKINFQAYGQNDAAEGFAYSGLGRYSYLGSCTKFDERYRKNYDTGIERYESRACNYDGGVELGRKGYPLYQNMCAKFDHVGFMKGYESGSKDRRIKQLEEDLSKAKEKNTCTSDMDCRKDAHCRFGKCEP